MRRTGDNQAAASTNHTMADFGTAPDYVVVGHVSRDVVVDGYRLGGTVTYAGLAAARLGYRVGIVTSAGPDLDVLGDMSQAATAALGDAGAVGGPGSGARIEVAIAKSDRSTSFENVYDGGHRRQYLRSRASSITASQIPENWKSARVVHLGPIARECDPGLFAAFHGAAVRGVTPQGWLRRWDEYGHVEWADFDDPAKSLGGADVVILSIEDVGGDQTVIDRYARHARRLVVTYGSVGAALYVDGRRTVFPAHEVPEVDPTGAGDVFAAGLLLWLARSGDIGSAIRFANAAASFAVEGVGTTTLPTRGQAEERLISGAIEPAVDVEMIGG